MIFLAQIFKESVSNHSVIYTVSLKYFVLLLSLRLMFIRLTVGGERTGIRRGYVASVIRSIGTMEKAIITILDAMNLVIGVPRCIALLFQSTTETDISIPTAGVCQEGEDKFTKNML